MYDFFNVICHCVILVLTYVQARQEMMYSLTPNLNCVIPILTYDQARKEMNPLPPPPPERWGGGLDKIAQNVNNGEMSPAASVGKTAPDLSAYLQWLNQSDGPGVKISTIGQPMRRHQRS
jgi:hypothetical protein